MSLPTSTSTSPSDLPWHTTAAFFHHWFSTSNPTTRLTRLLRELLRISLALRTTHPLTTTNDDDDDDDDDDATISTTHIEHPLTTLLATQLRHPRLYLFPTLRDHLPQQFPLRDFIAGVFAQGAARLPTPFATHEFILDVLLSPEVDPTGRIARAFEAGGEDVDLAWGSASPDEVPAWCGAESLWTGTLHEGVPGEPRGLEWRGEDARSREEGLADEKMLDVGELAARTTGFDDEEEVCPVCREGYEGGVALEEGDMCVRLRVCGHLMHGGCLGELVSVGTGNAWVTCPVCRGRVCRARTCGGRRCSAWLEEEDDAMSVGSSVDYMVPEGYEAFEDGEDADEKDVLYFEDRWSYDNDILENDY